MTSYIIHLYPEPYGFEVKAKDRETALKIAQERWEKHQDYDFDVDDSRWTIQAEIEE